MFIKGWEQQIPTTWTVFIDLELLNGFSVLVFISVIIFILLRRSIVV